MALLTGCTARRIALSVAGAVLLTAAAHAQQRRGEDAIKAAYLYNFTKFVQWPAAPVPGPPAAFRVCVFAEEGFRRELDAVLAGELVENEPVVTQVPHTPEDLRLCRVLYFGVHESDRAARLLPSLGGAAVLTVGEGPRFLELGGHIAFVLEADRVRFDVNKRAADAAGLTVSSKLLRVARHVTGTDRK